MKTNLIVVVLFYVVLLSACSSARKPVTAPSGSISAPSPSFGVALRGGGATFPAPLYDSCIQAFNHENSTARIGPYEWVGSMEGVNSFQRGKWDFAGSDWPVEDSVAPVQIPIVAGAVVIIYNVPGVPKTLNFTPQVLAGIFGGKIRRWNDPAITRPNPEVHFPSAEIVVMHRSDGSGTTHIFTNFLLHSDTDWTRGNDFVVDWPRGSWSRGVEGNADVLYQVARVENSIGYVENAYVIEETATVGHGYVLNRGGSFVPASIETISRAMPGSISYSSGPIALQERFPLAEDPNAYPISGFTWLLLRPNPGNKKTLSDFAEWLLGPCQIQAPSKGYVPIPSRLVDHELKIIDKYRSESER